MWYMLWHVSLLHISSLPASVGRSHTEHLSLSHSPSVRFWSSPEEHRSVSLHAVPGSAHPDESAGMAPGVFR